jgi:hypothetical protein
MIHKSIPLICLCASALLLVRVNAATVPSASPSPLPSMAQSYLDELKKPEYAAARCILSPVMSSDAMTVAISGDHIFAAGDTIIAVGGDQVDLNEKNPVRALLMKHGGDEAVQVKLRRADKELAVTAKCTNAKPAFDLLLEAAYSASKNDAATCSDKMNAMRQLHALYASQMSLAFQCTRIAGRFSNAADLARGYYEVNREVIVENAWSPDALGRIRGTILTAVDNLKKPNGSPLLADDLKAQFDQALAAKSQPATASASTGH